MSNITSRVMAEQLTVTYLSVFVFSLFLQQALTQDHYNVCCCHMLDKTTRRRGCVVCAEISFACEGGAGVPLMYHSIS